MLFNSLEFAVFFAAVTLLYYRFEKLNAKLWILFFSSCYFYAFFVPSYLLILFLVIGVDFYAGLKLADCDRRGLRKVYLSLSLLANFSILAFFKYSNFLIANVNDLARLLHWNYSLGALRIILPIGLSFHTFQSMAYVIEVYRGHFKPEKNLLKYAVYVLYFPQLVAGPIERPQNILPQLETPKTFDYEKSVTGLYLIAQGLFKKAVIADTLSQLANLIFKSPDKFGGLSTFLGVTAFSFQIYCDFSGYSDIARGTSRILGIELMLNFNKPYLSRSISEFWRRWHISLSTWFRDYVYIPLGGNREGSGKTAFNLLLVFTISGFWHGANWTFIIWGMLHGMYLLIETFVLKSSIRERWPVTIRRLYVFFLVGSAWIFFRADNVSAAMSVFKGFSRPFLSGMDLISPHVLFESLIFTISLILFESLDEFKPFWKTIRAQKTSVRWTLYLSIILVFLFVVQISGNQFIYFQF